MKKINNTLDNKTLDVFEVPENLWTRVENGLIHKKNKLRGFAWWQVAAGVAVLIGIGTFLFSSINNGKTSTNDLKAQNNTIVGDTTNSEVSEDTSDYYFGGTQPLAYGPAVVADNSIKTVQDSTFLTLPSLTPVDFQLIPLGGVSKTLIAPNAFVPAGNGQGSGTGYAPIVQSTNGTLVFTSRRKVKNGTYLKGNIIRSQRELPTLGYFSSHRSANEGSQNLYQIRNEDIYVSRINKEQNWTEPSNLYLNPVSAEENITRLNYRTQAAFDFLDGDLESSIFYETGRGSVYDEITENEYLAVLNEPQSTFSIDVDGASYSDVRGYINRNQIPTKNAVRLEEFVNYFPYDYPEPTGEHPFSINTEISNCPWNPEHKLMKIGIKGRSIEKVDLPRNNLVFLLDVSGSMDNPEKLDLLKKGFRLLVNELRENDRVSIVVYAGASGLVLPPTSGENKDLILDALDRLSAGGSTAGGQGIMLAYKTAERYFDENGNNRVILATDGDFNVGVSGDDELVTLIEEKRKSGVFLTVLGFGHDNFQSSKMEKLANNGNGNFSFIDNVLEAKKVLVTEMGATLFTIAKDVKIQVEFNPLHVGSYRLLGYENRLLDNADFSNDTIDAGELGAGHTVTAVYEIIPATTDDATISPGLKYSRTTNTSLDNFGDEFATVKFRYKEPTGTKSKLIETVIKSDSESDASNDFKFVQAVLEFGLLLRESQYAGNSNFDHIVEQAVASKGKDPFGYRTEFIRIVEKTRIIWEGGIIE